MVTAPDEISAVVLAGGRASRMDGIDKTLLDLDGRRLVEGAVAAARVACARVVVVGPPRVQVAGARRVREDPPFGGPVAALGAALAQLAAPWTLVLAADLVRPELAVSALLARPLAGDGRVLVDPGGRPQWLSAVYATTALRRALAVPAPPGTTDAREAAAPATAGAGSAGAGRRGASMRAVVARLSVEPTTAEAGACADVDTWEDWERVRAERARGRIDP